MRREFAAALFLLVALVGCAPAPQAPGLPTSARRFAPASPPRPATPSPQTATRNSDVSPPQSAEERPRLAEHADAYLDAVHRFEAAQDAETALAQASDLSAPGGNLPERSSRVRDYEEAKLRAVQDMKRAKSSLDADPAFSSAYRWGGARVFPEHAVPLPDLVRL